MGRAAATYCRRCQSGNIPVSDCSEITELLHLLPRNPQTWHQPRNVGEWRGGEQLIKSAIGRKGTPPVQVECMHSQQMYEVTEFRGSCGKQAAFPDIPYMHSTVNLPTIFRESTDVPTPFWGNRLSTIPIESKSSWISDIKASRSWFVKLLRLFCKYMTFLANTRQFHSSVVNLLCTGCIIRECKKTMTAMSCSTPTNTTIQWNEQ